MILTLKFNLKRKLLTEKIKFLRLKFKENRNSRKNAAENDLSFDVRDGLYNKIFHPPTSECNKLKFLSFAADNLYVYRRVASRYPDPLLFNAFFLLPKTISWILSFLVYWWWQDLLDKSHLWDSLLCWNSLVNFFPTA